jgi:predicted transcriptional regulator
MGAAEFRFQVKLNRMAGMHQTESGTTLGPLQQEVLNHIWQHPACAVRDIVDALGVDGRDYAYTTIQTVCDALHRKRLVERRRAGAAYLYTACETRAGLFTARLRDLLGRLGGEPQPVASSLVDVLEADAPEQLAALIDELRQRGKI